MSTESEESFSSDGLDTSINKASLTVSEITSFFSQYSYITSPVEFLEKIDQSYTLSSGDLILAVAAFANYANIKGFVEKRFKKTLNSLIEGVTGDVALFFCPRIVNVPLQLIYELYSKLDLAHDYYIVVSRLYKVEKEEIDEIFNTFKEYTQNDLRYFPCFNEEIFLLESSKRQNTEIKGCQCRIQLLSKAEFQTFLIHFANELKE